MPQQASDARQRRDCGAPPRPPKSVLATSEARSRLRASGYPQEGGGAPVDNRLRARKISCLGHAPRLLVGVHMVRSGLGLSRPPITLCEVHPCAHAASEAQAWGLKGKRRNPDGDQGCPLSPSPASRGWPRCDESSWPKDSTSDEDHQDFHDPKGRKGRT